MSDFLSHFDNDGVLAVSIFAIMGTVAIVATIAGVWCHWRKMEMEAMLKAEMIKQNRSVEEIERILKATGKTDKDTEFRQKVVKMAMKEGKSAEEIDRLLRTI